MTQPIPSYPVAARWRALLATAAAALLAGCGSTRDFVPYVISPYRPDVQQGNIVTQEMAENVHPGLSRDQVRFILGTPLLTSVFHQDRWDYVYYLQRGNGETQRRRLTVTFNGNRVDAISHDNLPPEALADNLILGSDAARRRSPPANTPSTPAGPAPTAPAPGTPTNPGGSTSLP